MSRDRYPFVRFFNAICFILLSLERLEKIFVLNLVGMLT
jgi:hypothetical protein